MEIYRGRWKHFFNFCREFHLITEEGEEILNFIRLDTNHIREEVKEFRLIRILLGKMEEILKFF